MSVNFAYRGNKLKTSISYLQNLLEVKICENKHI